MFTLVRCRIRPSRQRLTWPAAALACVAWLCGCSADASRGPAPGAMPDDPPATLPLAHSPSPDSPPETAMVSVKVINAAGELVGPVNSPRVVKTDAQWQAQLSPEQYQIARGKGTERAFCGTLLDNKKDGIYACVCCGLPLFSSNAKFNSGTGWPSFFKPVADENVVEHEDNTYGMIRVEILCARCDGHLGHVFDDGPRPTGLRFCVNSESLKFIDATDLKNLADPAAGAKARATLDDQSARSATSQPALEKAVFAGGCFWCVEAVFEELDGVKEVISGYAGGSKSTATYEAVCSGTTGHAEAVEIIYDPATISYEELLKVHFATHDPTSLNRQGADVGTQYRSAIFFLDDRQKQVAEAFFADVTAARVYDRPIVTTLEPLKADAFYPAETYHQNYVCNNPNQSYVRGVALPKVDKVRKEFKDALKDKSPLQK